ncbi:MAG: alkaline phosphatase [Dysgonomonas sp.]|nr:alkaline phosphatase [Dysgonomonas sp.]
MKKIGVSLLLLLVFSTTVWAQQYYRKPVKPTKNVIVMIPDGTSIGVVSAARWYQIYNKLGNNLAIDPYMCGTVLTYCSNAPIGDSAPTTACYMTGIPQQAGNVSIYPKADPENDLYPLDPTMRYQPLATVLEAAKYQQNKATGLVVTIEFPHATPADCASHYYDRGKYEYIAPQMAYQNLDVMFGGGNSILTDDIKQHFENIGTTLIQDDVKSFRNFDGKEKVWALFCERDHPYDLDRDPEEVPSLEEMTQKALDRLSQDENGFFLMVEGSKIDWSAHGNDAVGCITEYLAFDKAVKAAMDFAEKNGETTVIVLPDHGNSGFTIGRRDLKGYAQASLEKLFGNISKYKRTGGGLENILLKSKPENFKAIFKEYTNIDLTKEELDLLLSSKNYKETDYMQKSNSVNMGSSIVNIMNSRTYFGFTTGGHTGEEVFLAGYHPQGDIPNGVNSNVEINQYLCEVLGLKTSLPEMTKEIFAKHTEVFSGLKYEIDKTDSKFPVLKVKKGKNILSIPAFKSVAYLNNKPMDIKSVVIYIDKNDTFYLPKSLADKL